MQKRWIGSLVILVAFVGGCEALRGLPDDKTTEDAEDSRVEAATEIVEDVQELRQREPESPLTIAARDGDEATTSVPTAVAEEWQALSPLLFGGDDLELVLDDPQMLAAAQFDRESKELVVTGDPSEEEISAFAVAMAANLALEEQAFGQLASADSVDGWLAKEIIRRAGPAFVASAVVAERNDLALGTEDLAERPELLAHVPGVAKLIEPVEFNADMLAEMDGDEGTDYFEDAMEQLVMRKALSAGAALYRAGGWAGVDWGPGEPPERTEQVVRMDKWLAGEGPAQWEWPQDLMDARQEAGWRQVRQGRVGPAMTALWLEGLVGPMAARTIYGGWMADSYRILEREDEEGVERALMWVSAWETPHDAQEIAAAAEAVIGHFRGSESRDKRFRVAVQGLNVAVLIHDSDQDRDSLNSDVEALTEARVAFAPGQAAPFDFVPTLYERYAATTEEAVLDLDGGVWLDPASGWRAEVGALDQWSLQRSDEAHVRWFATHPDGALMQWTTELVNPLGPDFGSDAYLETLSEAFGESIASDEDPDFQVLEEPVDPTVQMEILGLIDERPTVLHLWQWRRGDVLVTFSVQAMEQNFGEHLGDAETVVDSLEPYGEPVEQSRMDQDAPGEDEGIIEFRVE